MPDDFGEPPRSLPPALAALRVCGICASAALRTARSEAGAQPHLECAGCGRAWYANPKPTANVFATRESDGHVILVRRAQEPFAGYWDIPGGFIEDGEEPMSAALRELREETGLVRVRLTGFVGAFADQYGGARGESTCNLFWAGVADDPDDAAAGSDAADLQWFSPDDMPADSDLAFTCVARAVAAWRQGR